MSFKQSQDEQLINVSFSTLIKNNFPFRLFFFQINSRKLTFLKPKTAQTINFLLKSTKTILPETRNIEQHSTDLPQTRSLQKLKQYFFLCAIVNENF